MKTMIGRLMVIAAVAALLGVSCQTLPEDVATPVPNIPAPTLLSATIGADRVTLSWQPAPGFSYAGFAVYRSDDNGASWHKAGTVTAAPYVDTAVHLGTLYWYRVAGVNADGLIGTRSAPYPARAAVYAVLISGGADYTNQRGVVLTFTAPAVTQHVRFGEDSTFAGVDWRPYALSYGYTLSDGDGPKTVYAQFRDDASNLTSPVHDAITLDTFAEIASTGLSPTTPIAPGATVTFTITPSGGELGGHGSVYVDGYNGGTIDLLDDGRRGDATAGDGVYTRDFTFPLSFRAVGATVTGVFTDAAGNSSSPVQFNETVTVTDPPQAVFLFPAADSTTTSIKLRWTASDDPHFARYEIYRDVTSAVDPATSPRIATVGQSTATTYTDGGLIEGREYWYRVLVINDLDETAASNVRSAHTFDEMPTAVTLNNPSSVTPSQVTLTWSRNYDTDFDHYEVWYSTSAGVANGGSSVQAGNITDAAITYTNVTGLTTGSNTYYFRVYVYDAAGNATPSNEVTTAP